VVVFFFLELIFLKTKLFSMS